jgi:general secretion pathway protein B
MSMILDALKKADAERQLGELPGLHTLGWPGLAPAPRTGLWHRRSTWLVLAVPILLLAVLFWLNRREAPPASIPSPVPAVVAIVAAPPPLPASNDVPMPPRLPKEATKEATKVKRAPAVVADRKAAVSPQSNAAAANVLTLATLPANLQRELPTLSIGGSMYSDNPAERMLLIDKRLLKEGDEIAPGLVLDSILPNGAILRYKGFRFQLVQ